MKNIQTVEKKDRSCRFGVTAAAAAFLVFTFGVFGPLGLFISNYKEFFFSVDDIWWICLLASAAGMSVLLGIGALFRGKARSLYTFLLFGLALGLYLQGNWVHTQYGVLNGTIDWSDYASVTLPNTLLWIACLATPFLLYWLLPKSWKMAVVIVSLGIVLTQTLTLGYLFATTDLEVDRSTGNCSFTNQGEFELSQNDNIVVFVLDCYDSKDFQRFMDDHPSYEQTVLKDFTYYPNTVGGATRTILALPYILTGQPYTTGGSYPSYLVHAYEEAPLYNELQKAGYNTGIYTESSFSSAALSGKIVNLGGNVKTVNSHSKLAYYLYRFTACSYFPHIFKQAVWMYSGDFDAAADVSGSNDAPYLIDDARFYEKLCQKGLEIQADTNAFRLYHLNGNHPPFTLGENAQRADGQVTSEEQQEGVWRILQTYFDDMRANGIYDNATIILMADHGAVGYEQNPVLLIKEGKNGGTYSVSRVPVSYQNFQPTLLSLLGANNTGIKSVFDLRQEDNPDRYFYMQQDTAAAEYVIRGDAGDESSVGETGKMYPIFSSETADTYEVGTTVFFDERATGNAYIISGFPPMSGPIPGRMGMRRYCACP